jgi:tripartite-type tricarboxylate transporter receptor subunit TctC
MRSFDLLKWCSAAAATLLAASAFSQGAADAYPSKPVTVVNPYAPGGTADTETRLYTAKLMAMTGQPFIVDYKPGAGTAIGTAYVAKAPADGHTLLVATGSLTVLPALYKDLTFDAVKDFAPVSLMSQRTSVLIAHPSFPAKNFVEYIAYAKAHPGKINFGTAGAGSITHLAGAWIDGATRTSATFIHYKGTGPVMPDLLAGRVDVTAAGLLSALPFIKSGKLRAVAVMGAQQSKLLPGVQTIAEQGIPGYNYASWLGISAPGSTPPAIVNKLSEVLARVAKSPDVAGPLEAEGGTMIGSTPAQFRQVIVTEIERWQKVVRDAGIKLEQ